MSACKGHFKSRSGKQWQGIFVSGEIIFSVTGEKAQEHLLQNNVCVCSCACVSMCVCMCVCTPGRNRNREDKACTPRIPVHSDSAFVNRLLEGTCEAGLGESAELLVWGGG